MEEQEQGGLASIPIEDKSFSSSGSMSSMITEALVEEPVDEDVADEAQPSPATG